MARIPLASVEALTTAVAATVRKVNGVGPDGAGNVVVAGGSGGSATADASDLIDGILSVDRIGVGSVPLDRLTVAVATAADLTASQSATTAALADKADTTAVPGLAPVQAVAGLTGSPTAAQVKTALALASSDVSDFAEAAQDAVAALLAAGTGVTLSYNDAGNTLTVTSAGTGGVTDPEVVRDTIGTALLGVGVVSVAVNDAADTITISSTATVNRADSLNAPLASPAFTGTPTGISKAHVGLSNVDNTADSAKPVSAAQQTALDGKLSGVVLTQAAYNALTTKAPGYLYVVQG